MQRKAATRNGSELGFTQIHNWPSSDKHLRKSTTPNRKLKLRSHDVADESVVGDKHVHKIHPSEMASAHPHRHRKSHLLKPRGIEGIFRDAMRKVTRKKKD